MCIEKIPIKMDTIKIKLINKYRIINNTTEIIRIFVKKFLTYIAPWTIVVGRKLKR